MTDELITGSLLRSLAGRHITGGSVTDAEREIYRDLIEIQRHPAPIHVRCTKHPGQDNLLLGEDDPPTAVFRRTSRGYECVACDDGANTIATEIRSL